ncbi:hypothetical protein MALU111345_12655 [Marinicrinis lubricantis]
MTSPIRPNRWNRIYSSLGWNRSELVDIAASTFKYYIFERDSFFT